MNHWLLLEFSGIIQLKFSKKPQPQNQTKKNPADFVQALEVLLIHLLYIADCY